MKFFNKLDRYLIDARYKVTIIDNAIYILNYLEIIDFSSTKVVIKYKDGIMILMGTDLVVCKMLDEELVIEGKLKCIEYN